MVSGLGEGLTRYSGGGCSFRRRRGRRRSRGRGRWSLCRSPPRDHDLARARFIREVRRQGRLIATSGGHHVLGQDEGMFATVAGAYAAGLYAVPTVWEIAITLDTSCISTLSACWCQGEAVGAGLGHCRMTPGRMRSLSADEQFAGATYLYFPLPAGVAGLGSPRNAHHLGETAKLDVGAGA